MHCILVFMFLDFMTKFHFHFSRGRGSDIGIRQNGYRHSIEDSPIGIGIGICCIFGAPANDKSFSGTAYCVHKAMKIVFCGGRAILRGVLKLMKDFCGSKGKGSGKTMKAPGRPYCIPRSTFESNPKAYFCQLRSDGL
ncbi:hypothetical protein AMTRI_Chr01g129060 [Amborella trichopoda]